MRSPTHVLNSLASKSEDTTYVYARLYRNLYNPSFYLLAYQNIYSKEGNMTPGTDNQTIDGMSLERIEEIIERLKSESYQPTAVKRTYIPKKNGKKRALGIPSVDDKLVQEVLRMILSSIYEGAFVSSSHGFRPGKSCHSALQEIKTHFDGVRWFLEGDIEGFFDSMDHHIVIQLLRKRIKDEKFIRLIWKFLRAGYLEQWTYHKTFSGTPQGGILSPILANIYLHELDKKMKEYINQFNTGQKRKSNPEYERIQREIVKQGKRWQNAKLSMEEKQQIHEHIKRLKYERRSVPATVADDETFKRLYYVRYADDFLIGVIGSKRDTEQIKRELTTFLQDKLRLHLSSSKTLITHSKQPALFLGYHVVVSRNQSVKRCKDGKIKRTKSYTCQLYVPKEKWVGKLKDLGAMKITPDGVWKPTHRASLIGLDDLEILSIYNSQIRGIYNYYQMARNASVLNKFFYHMKYSMYKTFANKYKTTINHITNKYCRHGWFTVSYETQKGWRKRTLYAEGFRTKKPKMSASSFDILPNEQQYKGESSLITRLKASKCEWCGEANTPLEIHHVRKLKDLNGKAQWEKWMIGRQRKTAALCHTCHQDLHRGKLD